MLNQITNHIRQLLKKVGECQSQLPEESGGIITVGKQWLILSFIMRLAPTITRDEINPAY